MKTSNRWVIAIAGVFLQIALGAVYAWGVFRVPLSKQEIGASSILGIGVRIITSSHQIDGLASAID
jgi:hypothetical protein